MCRLGLLNWNLVTTVGILLLSWCLHLYISVSPVSTSMWWSKQSAHPYFKRCSHQYTVLTLCFHPKRKPTISSETGTVVTHRRNVILMFSNIHLSIGVFLRCNFLCFTVIALYNFNCIHARLLRDFLIKYQYQ